MLRCLIGEYQEICSTFQVEQLLHTSSFAVRIASCVRVNACAGQDTGYLRSFYSLYFKESAYSFILASPEYFFEPQMAENLLRNIKLEIYGSSK